MKKGLQMYAIRALAQKDMEKAISTVSDIGYDGVEFAGFFGHCASKITAWLKKYKLSVLGAHVCADLMFDHPDETIAFHREIGNNRIICPSYPLETMTDVKSLCEKYRNVASQYKDAGMKLYYHNHATEFKMLDDERIIDIIASELSPEILSLEFDMYWVYRGGSDPLTYLEKYADRLDIFHAKDGIDCKGTALSHGNVDMKSVFSFAKSHDMAWAVVESETSEDLDEQVLSIKTDYNELLKLMV